MILLISPNHTNIVYPSEFVKSSPGIVIVSASFRVVELCLVKLGMDWNDILLPCSRAPLGLLQGYHARGFWLQIPGIQYIVLLPSTGLDVAPIHIFCIQVYQGAGNSDRNGV